MDAKKRIFWIAAIAAPAIAVAVLVAILVARQLRTGADRLVGSWEGRALGNHVLSGTIGDESFQLGSTNAESTLCINADGTMEWWLHAWGEGFNFELTIPDPGQTAEKAYWSVIESNSREMTVRLGNDEGPHYRLVFSGRDEFQMIPLAPESADQILVFHRARVKN